MMLNPNNKRISPLMALLVSCLLALLLLLLTAQAVSASDARPAESDLYWRAVYWNNTALEGAPVLERSEVAIDYDWGEGSPHPAVRSDRFSARWTRYIDVEPGAYRFTATSDDGLRLWLDDRLLIDQWYEHAPLTYSAEIYLGPEHHRLAVEYFEKSGAALVRVHWQRRGETPGGRWHGEYYANRTLSGIPAFVRDDDAIDFDWGESAPDNRVGSDDFSVRWTGDLALSAGLWRFTVTTDDGARLWVNRHLLIDAWHEQPVTTYRETIYLPGGTVPVRLEYFERSGSARISLRWDRRDAAIEEDWRGEYYGNRTLSGSPVFVRYESDIDFDWDDDAPDSRLDNNNFSVRWTSVRHFERGRYRFSAETDDGVRLWVDDHLLIDKWEDRERTRTSRSMDLDEGPHALRMEYYEHRGEAVARLWWKQVEEDEEERTPVGNIITCVPPESTSCAWIKLYRLDPSGEWVDISPRGFTSCSAGGFLKIDGLPVDMNVYGEEGQPYRVEQWVDGKLVRSVGNVQQGEPEFRVRPYTDNITPWSCTP